jgi:hypothetical protein
MIEAIVASLALKGGTRLLRAAVEDRDLSRADASEMATALLDAIVTGQRKTNTDLQRIEQKIDDAREDPYHAAMTSGAILLQDAAPAHRRPEHRQAMLDDARLRFADAKAAAKTRPVDLARAHVMYGLTWLALGEPQDFAAALHSAIRILQQEALTAFQLMCQWERDQERRRAAPATRIREVIAGPDVISDWSASNRWQQAQTEHDGAWELYVLSHETCPYPRLDRPHGSAYSHPRPGLPVYGSFGKTVRLLDADVTLSSADLTVANHGATYVRAELVPSVMDSEKVVSPDVSALDRAGTMVRPGENVRLSYTGSGRPAACLFLGQAERVDLLVLLHNEFDRSSPMEQMLRPFRKN